jgi:uncharacterized damage-inducible protein DinB
MDLDVPRALAYDRAANLRALASLEATPSAPPKAEALLAHLVGAQACWIHRMVHGCEADDVDRWDALPHDALREACEVEVPEAWARFLRDAALAAPSREFTYVNFLGETRSAVVRDTILGLLLHSEHHRGQIAMLVRDAGGTPAVTDFLAVLRAGSLA